MSIVYLVFGAVVIQVTLADGFETILQPRRIMHRYRLARLYYNATWTIWRAIALRMKSGKRRESFLSVFGPLSMLGLILTWLTVLILGFALVHFGAGTTMTTPDLRVNFGTCFYLSGTTFFTLGFGDVTPLSVVGRTLAVLESGLGFGFLAVIISYLPVLYQAYSQRETSIQLLDARAGSPPSAMRLLTRVARAGNARAGDDRAAESIRAYLIEWERWSAELLHIHLSFPVLTYYRSQHDNQSWLAALTTILDTCAILIVELHGRDTYQAQLTFAMARHAAVDLNLIFKSSPVKPKDPRLSTGDRQRLRAALRESGLSVIDSVDEARLTELREMYEPFLAALADRFLFTLPPLIPAGETADNWQRSAWMRKTPGIGALPSGPEHF